MVKILMVEDDPFLSSLLKNRLQKEGLEVKNARDGDEALAMVKSEPFDLMLLDVILPKKSGFEVLEEVRQDPKVGNILTVIISNLGQPEDVTRGQELGAADYFVKAKTSIDDLVTQIKAIIEQHKK